MVSIKPRVNVVVEPAQHALLARLGEIQGRSASSYLRELLDGAEPYLRHLLELETARIEGVQEFSDKVRSISATVLDSVLATDQGNLFGNLAELKRISEHQPDASPAPHSERQRTRKRESGRKGTRNA